jgi:hypothetical protein
MNHYRKPPENGQISSPRYAAIVADAEVPGQAPALRGRRSNRGFWLIFGWLALGTTVVIAGALLARPDRRNEEARENLRAALAAAGLVREEAGSYAAATAEELGVVDVTLTFVPGDRASTGPLEVSVHATDDTVAAAALDPDGTCYWIRDGEDGTRFGTGSPCTGRAALGASAVSW